MPYRLAALPPPRPLALPQRRSVHAWLRTLVARWTRPDTRLGRWARGGHWERHDPLCCPDDRWTCLRCGLMHIARVPCGVWFPVARCSFAGDPEGRRLAVALQCEEHGPPWQSSP